MHFCFLFLPGRVKKDHLHICAVCVFTCVLAMTAFHEQELHTHVNTRYSAISCFFILVFFPLLNVEQTAVSSCVCMNTPPSFENDTPPPAVMCVELLFALRLKPQERFRGLDLKRFPDT